MREFKVECTKDTAQQLYGVIDYHYCIDDTIVNFTQHGCGEIYGVDIFLSERLNGFCLKVCFTDERYGEYPTDIILTVNATATEMNDAMIENLKYLHELANAIMNIFNVGQHKELFDKNFG